MPLCFDEIFLFFQDLKAKVQGMMLKYPWLTLLWNTIASKDFQILENCERSYCLIVDMIKLLQVRRLCLAASNIAASQTSAQ